MKAVSLRASIEKVQEGSGQPSNQGEPFWMHLKDSGKLFNLNGVELNDPNRTLGDSGVVEETLLYNPTIPLFGETFL